MSSENEQPSREKTLPESESNPASVATIVDLGDVLSEFLVQNRARLDKWKKHAAKLGEHCERARKMVRTLEARDNHACMLVQEMKEPESTIIPF